MSEPATPPAPGRGKTRTFRKYGEVARLTPQQMRRQNDVLQGAWRHFRMPAAVIAFLNTQHQDLQAQPLHLALESDEGLKRVEQLLATMTLHAPPSDG